MSGKKRRLRGRILAALMVCAAVCSAQTASLGAYAEGVQPETTVSEQNGVFAFQEADVTLSVGNSRTAALDGAEDYDSIRYSSSKPDIVSVDNKGVITALQKGIATITARANGKIYAKCIVRSVIPVEEVHMSKASVVLAPGQQYALRAKALPLNASSRSIKWLAQSERVAVVENGVITAKEKGMTIIEAVTPEGVRGYCVVIVKVPAESVEVDKKNVFLTVGETFTPRAKVLPENTSDKSLTWKSMDTNVVSVDNKGQIKAVGVGKTTVKAITSNKKTALITVKVYPQIESVSMLSELTMGAGEMAVLTAELNPSGVRNKKLTWSTSAPEVVSVENGRITARKTGAATVSVTSENGKTASCRILVKNAPESVSFDRSSVVILTGEYVRLNASLPEGSLYSPLTYKSSDPSVCEVNSSGRIQGIREGKAVITVTTENGKTDTCSVTVRKAATSIGLYVTRKTIAPGQSFDLKYYLPQGEYTKSITFSSSDTSVCTVTNSGTVKALATGSANIIVSTYNGKTAKCAVTVTNDKAQLEADPGSRLPVYQNFTAVSQYPELPTGCEITALTTVLNYYGFDVTKEEMADKYLEKGVAWLTDFHEKFAGDPTSQYSYGCYAPVIVKAANKYLQEQGSVMRAFELENFSFRSLFNFLDYGIPVLVWTTIGLAEGYYTATWTADNGKEVTWYANEHCMVLVGCNGSKVYAADPDKGKIVEYDAALFEKRYKELFSQSVVIQ